MNSKIMQAAINVLRNNIKPLDDINFCIMLSGTEKRNMPRYGEGSIHGFNVITYLGDRIIVMRFFIIPIIGDIDCHLIGERKLIDLDHIEISKSDWSVTIKIIANIPDQSLNDIRYHPDIHEYIIPYINTIREDIDKNQNTSSNLLDDLERLAKLKSQGAISEDEFVAAKKKLLG